MNLLLDLKLNEPPTRPDYEAGLSLKLQFDITLATNPSKAKLTVLLQELKDFA